LKIAGSHSPHIAKDGANGIPADDVTESIAHSAANGIGASLHAIPDSPAVRLRVENIASGLAVDTDGQAESRAELERLGRLALDEADLPERFLGYAMVLLGNAKGRRRFLAVPFERRLFLLPRRIPHMPGCVGDGGLTHDCCSACLAAAFEVRARSLGYKVLVAESSPTVLASIAEGGVDAVLGIASLRDLEKAIDKVLLAGIPSMAVPLPDSSGGSPLEDPWVADVLGRYEPLPVETAANHVNVLRAAVRLFREDFNRLLPRVRSATPGRARTPLGLTEDVAYDWLANGGKRFRPFITLAAYDAATAGSRTAAATSESMPFPDSVCRVAMAIEAFHKASLVHDDIQDDDLFRYGRETLHRSHGLGPAINIGDYLIGLGYRLVNSCRTELGGEVASDIVASMAEAHLRLCDGQGAEMAWRDQPDWSLTPRDALRIYSLKTSPAFEAALYAGLRMAGPVGENGERVAQFCRQLGVGFQILNDLKDWEGDHDNKLVAGQDALALRPTVLLGLALEAAGEAQKVEIREILESSSDDVFRVSRLRELFQQLGAFARAEALVEQSRSAATTLAAQAQPEALSRLLGFLVETVLEDERKSAAGVNGVVKSRPSIETARA